MANGENETIELDQDDPGESESKKFGVGFFILILFAAFVDILEIIATATVVAIPFVWIFGLIVDTIIFIGFGVSRKARRHWGKFAIAFIAENFPVLSSAIEFLPIRTASLIWIWFTQD